jgi:hypothetical protein
LDLFSKAIVLFALPERIHQGLVFQYVAPVPVIKHVEMDLSYQCAPHRLMDTVLLLFAPLVSLARKMHVSHVIIPDVILVSIVECALKIQILCVCHAPTCQQETRHCMCLQASQQTQIIVNGYASLSVMNVKRCESM